MSFTFHYCKKIPGTREGLPGVAFLNSSPAPEMRRFPKSLVCRDGESINVGNSPALQTEEDPKANVHIGVSGLTHKAARRSPKQGALITLGGSNGLFYTLFACGSFGSLK